jgi:hemolysin activation/secretion protein
MLFSRTTFLVLALACLPLSLKAGILDMPDTTDLPEAEKKSLLKDLDVPGVKDRDPNPEGGPRLNVTEFRVQGVVEYPELGISYAELIKRVEAIRFDLMGEGEKTKSGYTLKELAEMADLVAEIEETTQEQHVGAVEVQKLVFLIREQRRKRGITLGMIETVADTITQYYRERGFILAKAYIPQQQVRDGVVTLNVMLGKLGSVVVQNNKRYRASALQRVFASDLEQPVTAETIEENLYLVNDYPGLYAQGVFEPGEQVGDTRLNLNVTREGWFDTNLRMDNHGAKTTGEFRLYGDVTVHNPTTLGDQITLSALTTEEDSLYGAVRYSLPLYFPRLRLAAGYSTNDFVSRLGLGSDKGAGFEFSGNSKVIDGDLTYQIERGRKRNMSMKLAHSSIKTEITFGGEGEVGISNDVANTSVKFHFDYLNERGRSLHQLDVGVIQSDETPDEATVASDAEGEPLRDYNPQIFTLDYSLLTFFKNPLGTSDLRLVVNHSLQYAGKALAPVSQFDLSGPNRARGFALNHFVADDAAHLAADVIFPVPRWLQFGDGENASQDGLTPFILSDISYGLAYAQLDDSDSSDALLADLGVGLKLSTPWGLRGNLAVAFPVMDEITYAANESNSKKDNKDAYHAYFEFQYSY